MRVRIRYSEPSTIAATAKPNTCAFGRNSSPIVNDSLTLGAAARPDHRPDYAIEGFAYGLSKRSFEAR